MALPSNSLGIETQRQCDAPSRTDTERDLVSRLQSGDADAYETLVRNYGGRMLVTARRFFNCEQDAADAVQDAFISTFKSIGNFQGGSQLGTWLHRIVVNSCLMRRRSRDRHPTVAIESLLPQFDVTGHHLHKIQAYHDSPSDRLSISEIQSQVREGIDRLPEPYREVLVLREIEQFDTETTADILNVSIGVVKTRLHRSRQALRTILEPMLAD